MRFHLLYKNSGPGKVLRKWYLFALLLGTASAHGQKITLSVKNSPIQAVFAEIKKQTGYSFVYTSEEIKLARPVSLIIKDADLKQVLDLVFKDQSLKYLIEENYVIVKGKSETTSADIFEFKGRVTDEKGEGVAGASLRVKESREGTATDATGGFVLKTGLEKPTLLVSSIGFEPVEIPVLHDRYILIQLKISEKKLDEQLVIAYGTTTNRFNTGNVFKITAEEISRQPVSNILSALQGRVPGLVITQSSGIAGSSFKVQIRGQSSIGTPPGTSGFLPPDNPLFIIDGVPFEAGNLPVNLLQSAAGNGQLSGLSALNSINPSDVESIEILKDADATAIYGSRGANGVILITTKRARAGKTQFTIQAERGLSQVTRTMDMLSTSEYVRMRKEAFLNDGVSMNASNAPDILLWDTSRYTDFKKVFYHDAHYTDVITSFSAGTELTQFFISGGLNRQTNVFSNDLFDSRASLHFSINHKTENKKLQVALTGLYSRDDNHLITADPTQYLKLPPNLKLYDSLGNLNWSDAGVSFSSFIGGTNPLSELLKKYKAETENLNGNLQIVYRPFQNLDFKTSVGYNQLRTDENRLTPKASMSPLSSALASAVFGNSNSSSWIIEPQANYQKMIRRSRISLLLGGTWQQRSFSSAIINATNYSNDLLLNSMAAAGALTATNSDFQYRYVAFFGRLNYNYANRYILNLSARRDGSSRFGPGKSFSNFGAIGADWLFTNEKLLQGKLRPLSFGKIRMSYGVTGNDQIGEYRFLDLWSSSPSSFQGQPGLIPNSLLNSDYRWEMNRKAEVALEAGLFKDHVFLSVSFYRNRSGNQLINYTLPSVTGFTSVVQNFPAVVQNTGWEVYLSGKILNSAKWGWTSSLNFTDPKNKLASFPGLSTSSYGSSLVIGQPLSTYIRYRYTGVDPLTGVYTFQDLDKDGKITSPNDYMVLGNTDPLLYGGFENELRYKNLSLSLLIEFKKQIGRNYLDRFYNLVPGTMNNQPKLVLERWQKPEDQTSIQKFTQLISATNEAYVASALRVGNSDAIYTDASYLRLKNLAFSYELGSGQLRKGGIGPLKIFLLAQNLFVLTRYKGSDPETQNILVLPPLKTIAAGVRFTF